MKAPTAKSTLQTSERLIEKLHAAGELTPAFAFGALQQGRIRLFELTLAKLAELRPVVLRRMLYETGGGRSGDGLSGAGYR